MNSSDLNKKQKSVWKAIDCRFSELVKEYGSIIYCRKKWLNGSVYDGCLDVARYVKAPVHIMWILKEHNDQPPRDEEGHLVAFADCLGPADDEEVIQFRRNVSSYRSLRLIERASRFLLNLPEGDSTEAFKSVAIVNLGKCPGENKTPDSRLDDLVEWWGDILKRQVSDYKPDVVIVPGSHFSRVAKLLACNQKNGKFRKGMACAELFTNGNLPVIRIQHPSWFGCKEEDWMCVLSKAFAKALPHV